MMVNTFLLTHVSSLDRFNVTTPIKSTPTKNTGLSAGAKAGIALGVILGLALIAAVAFFLYGRKLQRREGEAPRGGAATGAWDQNGEQRLVHKQSDLELDSSTRSYPSSVTYQKRWERPADAVELDSTAVRR